MQDRDRSEVLLKQRKVLADFGDVALQSENLDAMLNEACRLVGDALGTGRSKVLEIEDGGETLFVRAGVGWAPDVVGHVRLRMEEHSSETYAIDAGEPVVTQDISKENRFDVPRFMKEAGVVALVNVPIFLPGKRAYGLLQVDDTVPRDFDQDDIEFLRTYATILGPIIDRLFKLQDLRGTEERFQAIVETATDYAIFTTDAEGRIAIWPRGAQDIFGWSPEEAVGQSVDITFTPEDRAAGAPKRERQEARDTGHAPDVRWHLRKDGRRVFIDGVTRPLNGPDGTLTGFVKVGQDVTERRATEEQLRESEERFRQFGEASSDVLWIRDCESLAYEYLSPAYEQVYGLPREEALRGNQVYRWMELIHPEDRDRVLDLLRRVRAGENATETYRVIRPSDGRTRWIRNTDFPLRDADGRVHRIGGLSHDTTEEIEARERLEVLVTELQHRTRNLIGVVNSIARQTMTHTGPTEVFREEFGHRMAALSRVQGLLSRAQIEPITLRALLKLELDAMGAQEGDAVRLKGPSVRIRPTIVQTVALVVHELATNARKYGALSDGGGRLSVEWRLHQVEGQQRVFIDWREDDLAPTETGQSAVEGGGGYGRKLIERALPYSLGAQTTYELEGATLRCTIDLPLDRDARTP